MIRWGISEGYHDASISVLDDDDIWMPNKLEIQLQEMQKNMLFKNDLNGRYLFK